MKKRVACFYRVSTKSQVIDDDIPAQRKACLDFINKHKDWEFTCEYIEKGVSGFKVSANDREKLEELKNDAISKKFDIVLVFLFDRLGRIEEETPFVLKWFVEQGIEMWSVNEGQRKFDNHVDNLLNYITFWQASGESIKTQIRTQEIKEQMRNDGIFQGCAAPYGYKHVSTGRHNEKGREIKDLVIDEEEAKIVKKMFGLVVQKGWGSRRISKLLNDNEIPSKRGGRWAGATVLGILKNSIYKGYFTYGRRMSRGEIKFKNQYNCEISDVKQEHLAIVSEEQWEEVKKIIESKNKKNVQVGVPKQTRSPLLLTGFIYCGECGERMTLKYSYNHYQRKDGTWNRDKKAFYQCYGKSNGLTECSNKNYAHKNLEKVVIKQIYAHLDEIENMNIDKELSDTQEKQLKESNKEIKLRKDKIKKIEEDLKLLKNEIINVIRGSSKFSDEMLTEQINALTSALDKENHDLEEYVSKVEEAKLEKDDLLNFKKQIPQWKDILESTDNEIKKMILPKFVSKVVISKDKLDVTINIEKHELLKMSHNYHHNV